MMFTEAASVCLDRHHSSPTTMYILVDEARIEAAISWDAPDARTRGAWANATVATEFGAYGVALAAIELEEQLVAVRRAETGTGADYYVAPSSASAEDLEGWHRLEVSGVNAGEALVIRARLHEKVRQTVEGNSNLPAIAVVVGFRKRVIAIARAELK
jgi:hypothetical protein